MHNAIGLSVGDHGLVVIAKGARGDHRVAPVRVDVHFGVKAQLQPRARDSRAPTRLICLAASVSGVEAVCNGVATCVPSVQAPLPPASMFDATSRGIFDRL